jgi:hypothetical protein
MPSTMGKMRSTAAAAEGISGTGSEGTTPAKILAPGGMLPLALRSSKRGKEDSGPGATSTPYRPPSKISRPQGTSPMARVGDSVELVDMEAHKGEEEESMAKSNPRSTDDDTGGDKVEQDSFGRAIAGVKKDLFKADGLSGVSNQGVAATSRRWKLIPKAATASAPHKDSQPSGTKGTKFADGTRFLEKVSAAKKTPGKDTKMNNCIVRIKIKLTGRHKDIPESIMEMINDSLAILHERDKKECYLNRMKFLEASKATNFPKDFTDFYDDWGVWDECIKAFANNIPANRSRSFLVSFNFRSKWDPAALLEKDISEDGHANKNQGHNNSGDEAVPMLRHSARHNFFQSPILRRNGAQGLYP